MGFVAQFNGKSINLKFKERVIIPTLFIIHVLSKGKQKNVKAYYLIHTFYIIHFK